MGYSIQTHALSKCCTQDTIGHTCGVVILHPGHDKTHMQCYMLHPGHDRTHMQCYMLHPGHDRTHMQCYILHPGHNRTHMQCRNIASWTR